MNPNREEALFALALEKPVERRAAFLDVMCEGDPALRARLDTLLAAHEATSGVFSTDSSQDVLATTLDLPQPAPDETVGMTLGRYRLREKLGEGGCGSVYVAEQTEPVRRRVALKVIKLGMDTREVIARFEVERQALAMMDHPNIAKVLDAGTTDAARPYFVMELVRGIKITNYCDQANLSTKDRLDLFIKVCQAIQHAHQKGIIHRDIKPSNILVTLHDGTPVPKVIDFGIAKATEGRLVDATVYTQLHQFMGTPAYMSPEQAEMSGLDVDTRSDIYSLGVLLYQLLTGKTPFDGKELMSMGLDAMRKTIREKEPMRPSTRLATLQGEELTTTAKRHSADAPRLIHLLKGDLDWIVMKALEKDRTRRYETANGLAADIQRHLANEPVVARPPSTAYKIQKAWQRNKLAFTAATAVALALIVGISVSTWQAVRATRAEREKAGLLQAANVARENEGKQRHLAERNAARAEIAVTRLEIDRAEMLFRDGMSSEALAYLARVVRREPTNRVAGERILSALAHRSFSVPLFRLQARGTKPAASFSPDGHRILIVSTNDGAQIRDGRTGQVLAGPFPHDGQILHAGFNSNGMQVVTVSDDRTARIWDAQTGQPVTPALQHASQVNAADFSPDGHHLVTGSADGAVLQWSTVTGEAMRTNLMFPGSVYHVKFSPDGRQLLVGFKSADSKPLESCRLVNMNDGTVINVFDGYSGGFAPEFSPDGTRLLVSSNVGDLGILGPGFGSTNGIRKTLHYATAFRSRRFSPDGQYVAASALKGFATLLEATTLKPVGETMRHEHWVLANAFSPDGQRLATGSQDHTVRIWETRTGRSLGEPLRHDAAVNLVQFSADGQRLLTVCEGGGVWVWEVRSAQSLAAVLQHPHPVRKAVFSPDGERAASATMTEGLVRLWDVTRASSLGKPLGIGMWEVQFSRDGRRLQGNNSADLTVWDASTGEMAGRHSYGRISPYTRFSPDGELVVIGGPGPGHRTDSSEANVATVWRIADGEEVARFSHDAPTRIARFSPDGRWVISTSVDKTARLWDWKTGKQLTEPLRHEGIVVWADVSSDSRRVLTLSTDKTACIWDAGSGKLLHTLPHGGEPYHYSSAEFSADGRRVVIASGSEAQIWDADTGLPVTAVLPHPDRVQSVKFSPDGQRLLTACLDRAARLWDTTTGHPVSEPLRHLDRVNYAEFSPDGRRVITASHDGTSRIFEVPMLTTPAPPWLADWAETVAGQRLDERNASQPVPFAELQRLRQNLAPTSEGDEAARWARWFFAENATRRISPGATLTVPQLVQQRIQDNTVESLQQALSLSPDNGLALARLAVLLLTNTTTSAPWLRASLEWQSRHGVELSPKNPDAWLARVKFLDQVGRSAEANEAMDRAAGLNSTNANFWNERGLRLEQAGRLQDALQSYTKAIEHSGPWKDPEALPAQAYRNRRNVNRRLNRIAEATADHLKYRNLPPRDPGAPTTLIDLSQFYTAGTDIRLATAFGHNFALLPMGLQKLAAGTEFDIRGVIRAFRTESAIYQPTGIGIHQKGRKLHFLHVGAAWKTEDGKEVGTYRLHYADGQQKEIPIRYGEHLRDQNPQWDKQESLAPNTRLAWIGDTPAGSRIRLFETVWENDRPEVTIESLDLIPQSNEVAILLFAITVEP